MKTNCGIIRFGDISECCRNEYTVSRGPVPTLEYMKRQHGVEGLDKFRDAACGAIEGASQGGAALAYGEGRIVGILPGHSRLKTFSIIEKLRRALPMLAQSFDCVLQPDFDVLEYEEGTGIAGVMAQLVTRPLMPMRDAA